MTQDEFDKEIKEAVNKIPYADRRIAFKQGAAKARELFIGEIDQWKKNCMQELDNSEDLIVSLNKLNADLALAVEALKEYKLQGKLFTYDGEKEIDDYGALAHITLAKLGVEK